MNAIFFVFIAIKAVPLAWELWAIGPLIVGGIGFLLLKFLNH